LCAIALNLSCSYTRADYIVSNANLNKVLRASADGTDDEEISYFVSLLRSFSMKLSPSTLQFFYDQVRLRSLLSFCPVLTAVCC
jgi:hypothetical protein